MSFRFSSIAVSILSLAACQSVHTQNAPAALPPAAGTPLPLTQPMTLSLAPGATPAPASPTATPVPAKPTPTPRLTYSSVHGVGRTIAMTFDDGPHPKLTPMLLDMLKQRGIHATFFLVGQNAAEYPDIVRRIVAEGHEVGNHSWSHPQLNHLSLTAVDSQIQKTNEAIHAALGYYPSLMRPPFGATTAALNRHYAQAYGLKVILWSVDPLDWKYRNAAHVEKEILSQVGPGGIVLSHDIHATTVAAMPDTLDALIAQGYKFVTVSQLIAMEGSVPTPTPAPTPVKPAKKKKTKSSETITAPTPEPQGVSVPATPSDAATNGKAAQ
jgi:peptidoglycan-N-acetylglucosamine deacetylase